MQLAACGGEVARGQVSEGSGGRTGSGGGAASASGGTQSGDTGGRTEARGEPTTGGASHAGAGGIPASMGGGAGSPRAVGGAGGAAPGTCWLTLPGATGEEPDGTIPICCSPTAEERERRDELISALNAYRAEEGLAAVQSDPAIQAAAQGYARHMDDHPFFDSSTPEAVVGTVWQAAALCDADVTAADLAANLGGPLDVLNTWIESASTDQWLVDPEFTRVGLGNRGYHWCLFLD